MPPPPPGIDGALSFSGRSTTTDSVVSSSPAMEAAFCSAVCVTLVGVDHAALHQVLVLVGTRIVTEARVLAPRVHHDGALDSSALWGMNSRREPLGVPSAAATPSHADSAIASELECVAGPVHWGG